MTPARLTALLDVEAWTHEAGDQEPAAKPARLSDPSELLALARRPM